MRSLRFTYTGRGLAIRGLPTREKCAQVGSHNDHLTNLHTHTSVRRCTSISQRLLLSRPVCSILTNNKRSLSLSDALLDAGSTPVVQHLQSSSYVELLQNNTVLPFHSLVALLDSDDRHMHCSLMCNKQPLRQRLHVSHE